MLFYLAVECPTTDAQFLRHQREITAVLLDGSGNGGTFNFFERRARRNNRRETNARNGTGLRCNANRGGEVCSRELGVGVEEEGAFHQILQFADVPREG